MRFIVRMFGELSREMNLFPNYLAPREYTGGNVESGKNIVSKTDSQILNFSRLPPVYSPGAKYVELTFIPKSPSNRHPAC
jgi:hypothetical protein